MNSTAGNDTLPARTTIEVVSDILQSLIFISALVGNSMLIISLKIRQSGGLKFVDKLMLNTVVCNLLFVIICIPVEIVQHVYHYPFTEAVCKLIDPLSTYLFSCCVFTYVAIAFERWVLISSMTYEPPTRVHTFLVFLAIHVCGLFSVSPYMPVLKLKDENGRIVCGETWAITSRKSYTLALFLLQYGVPVPLLVVFYAKAWFIVYESNRHLFRSMLPSSVKRLIDTHHSFSVQSRKTLGPPD